jgi:hypothetical protein
VTSNSRRASELDIPRRSDVEPTHEKLVALAERLTRLLDDGFQVPGTRFRFGLDPILGFFFPGVGDSLTGLGAIALLLAAIQRRVPKVVLLRMLVNIGIDVVLGLVPVVGDVFDLFWKSNRRNLDLLRKYDVDPTAKPTVGDYAVVAAGIVLVVVGAIVPWVLAYWLGAEIWRALSTGTR